MEIKQMPNLSIEQAREMISKLQRDKDNAIHQKYKAQATLFDILYEAKPMPKDFELKADNIYLKSELKEAIRKRDLYKAEADALRQEIMLMRAQNKLASLHGGDK